MAYLMEACVSQAEEPAATLQSEMTVVGELAGEYARLQETLRRWMRSRWLDHCNRPLSQANDLPTLRTKLRSAVIITRSQYLRLERHTVPRSKPTAKQVEQLESMIEVLTVEGESCR